MQGKEQVALRLKQAQEMFCLRELVVSSSPLSVTARDSQKAVIIFLEESLEKVTFKFCHFEETGTS